MLNVSKLALVLFVAAAIPTVSQNGITPSDGFELNAELRAAAHDSQPPNTPSTAEIGRGELPQRRPLDGKWQLAWDDSVNDRLDHEDKTCAIELREIDGTLTGHFIGDVAGRAREGFLSGRLEGNGPSRLLTFQQREKGYVCSYQAFDAGGEIRGVWHDTQNRSGTFRLLRFQ